MTIFLFGTIFYSKEFLNRRLSRKLIKVNILQVFLLKTKGKSLRKQLMDINEVAVTNAH